MTTTQNILNALGARILAATNLRDLCDRMNEFEAGMRQLEAEGHDADFENELTWAGVDLCGLPTFGGPDPLSTEGIWSWDEDSVLIVTDEHRWVIEARADVAIDSHGHTAADTHY